MALNRTQDVLKFFKVGKTTFYNRIYPALPPTLHIGNSPRWSDEALATWVEAQIAQTTK